MHDESSSVDAGKGTCHFLAAPVLTPPLNTSPSRHHALTLCASGSSVLLFLTSTILSTDALGSMISEWTALTHARSGVIQEFVVEVNPRARSGTGRLPFCSPAFPLPPSLSLLRNSSLQENSRLKLESFAELQALIEDITSQVLSTAHRAVVLEAPFITEHGT